MKASGNQKGLSHLGNILRYEDDLRISLGVMGSWFKRRLEEMRFPSLEWQVLHEIWKARDGERVENKRLVIGKLVWCYR